MKSDKLTLLEEAKKAYYSGNPIMGDEEYDALERELGLENRSEIGAHSKNYTVRHPFLMGSLSKIQVKNDDGKSWADYVCEIRKYIKSKYCKVSPKYDGCSFELVLDRDLNVMSVSTRGDGEWGKDIYKHVKPQIDRYVAGLRKEYTENFSRGTVIRGEVLVTKSDFEQFLSETYVNTRAFVAGSLNNDEPQETDKYLKLVMYDFRTPAGDFLLSADFRVEDYVPTEVPWSMYDFENKFEKLYAQMTRLRETIDFPLDGFVLKTPRKKRSSEFAERPKDCVAIKFAPAIVDTEIVDIEWNYSPKTAEYFPVGIIKPVILDSKTVTRVSLHNFGYVFENKVTPGAKVKVSMAGDIIPFLYAVVQPSETLIMTPLHTYVDGVHLYKIRTENEIQKSKFLASCDVLDIRGLGPALAETMYGFEQTEHVLLFDFDRFAKDYPGKTSENIREAARKFISDMSLAQYIKSLAIPFCGSRMSSECAVQLSGGTGDFTSMASAGYSWVFDADSPEYGRYLGIRRFIEEKYGKTFTVPKAKPAGGIKVVLTGSPKEFGYKTKGEFLAAHPDLTEVSNLKDADVLITDDLLSTSSKMVKAAKLGKEIKLYY